MKRRRPKTKLSVVIAPAVIRAAARAHAALEKAGVAHALIGGLAYDVHADEPSATADVDFVVDPERWEDAAQAIRRAGFRGGNVDEMLTQLADKDGVRVDLLFGVGDPEESARETAPQVDVLGTRMPVVRPEYLVWMWLRSDQPRHEARAITLLREGKVDVRKFPTLAEPRRQKARKS